MAEAAGHVSLSDKGLEGCHMPIIKSVSYGLVALYAGAIWIGAWVVSKLMFAEAPEADLWSKLTTQVPALCVLVFLVVYFLRHMESRAKDEREDRRAMRESFQSYTAQQTDKVVQVTEKASKSIDDNTKTMAEFKVILNNHLDQ